MGNGPFLYPLPERRALLAPSLPTNSPHYLRLIRAHPGFSPHPLLFMPNASAE